MVRTLHNVAISSGIVLAGLLAFSAATPEAPHVQRAVPLQVSPERVLAIVSEFHCRLVLSACDNLSPRGPAPIRAKTGADGVSARAGRTSAIDLCRGGF